MDKAYNIKLIFIIILICDIAFSSHLFSQDNYKRKISISEWIEEMENYNGKIYWLKDTEIYHHSIKDSLYSWNQPRSSETDLFNKREINIKPLVIIQNCILPNNSTCQIRNINFNKNVSFINCTGAGQLIIYNCTFKQGLDFHNCDLNMLEFEYCSILQRTIVIESQISLLSFSNCDFYTDYKVVESNFNIGYENENHSYQYLFIIGLNEKKINRLNLRHCKILPTKVVPVISLNGGKYDIIGLENTDFSNTILDFTKCSVKENFTVRDCKFKKPFGIYQFNFPKDNTSFHWSQLDSVGLGYYTNYKQQPFTSKADTLLTDVYNYNELNSSYMKFFSMYRTQGDIESANACYIQMKDMETKRYRHLYKDKPNVKKWFNWRFNQFLKYFSEYGTNPVQSLVISMWTILIFAAVYFFFYSVWDGINRTFLIEQHRKLLQYFRSEQKLEDFYTENYKEDFKTFADYKKEMEECKAELPFFIVLLGKPLYLLSVIRHKMLTFVYRRTEVLHGRWVNLNPARKVFVALVVVFSILAYSIYLIFVRALNSTTLSINSFSTLGFGAIPVKGVSRYITIIEGFIGWFLLSIFSVSLISQMLQN